MTDPWADVREQLVEDLGELFAQRFDELPDDYKPTFVDILAFLRGDPLAPEMTAMNVAESRRDRDALLAVVRYVQGRRSGMPTDGAYAMISTEQLDPLLAALPEHLKEEV